MFTDFLYVLLTIWSRLQPRSIGACRAMKRRDFGQIFSDCQSIRIAMMESLAASDSFLQTIKLCVCTSLSHFSTHFGLRERNPFDWWQAIFRLTLTLPLFGNQWSANRTRFGVGTV